MSVSEKSTVLKTGDVIPVNAYTRAIVVRANSNVSLITLQPGLSQDQMISLFNEGNYLITFDRANISHVISSGTESHTLEPRSGKTFKWNVDMCRWLKVR